MHGPMNVKKIVTVILLHLNHRLVSAIHVTIFRVDVLFKLYLHLFNARKVVHIKVQITFHIIRHNNKE